MQAYDNNGNLSSETNTCFVDGKVITTQTSYSNYGVNKALYQTITVRDLNTGKGVVSERLRWQAVAVARPGAYQAARAGMGR